MRLRADVWRREVWLSVLLVLALGVGPVAGEVAAQDSDDDSEDGEEEATELVFEREVFQYPAHQGDPFRPLTDEGAGPRFEDLTLLGVIAAGNAESSVALVGVRSGDRGNAQRVRVGDHIGGMRVVEVREREIVLEVQEFGSVEERPLRVQRPGADQGVEERSDGGDGNDDGDDSEGGDDADDGPAPGAPGPNGAGGSR